MFHTILTDYLKNNDYLSHIQIMGPLVKTSLITMLVAAIISPIFFYFAKKFTRSVSRERLPQTHQKKHNIPTMGGILIIAVILISTLCGVFYDLETVIALITLISFGILGACDDLYKILYKKGVYTHTKFFFQITLSLLITLIWMLYTHPSSIVIIPFTQVSFDLGYLFIPWCMLVIIATCNAVNITDGLDALATGSLIPNFLTLGFIAWISGVHTGLASFCLIIALSLINFLRYNCYPASLFMGDVGALSLGAVLAIIALIVRCELVLLYIGIVFVLETLSDIIQIISIRMRGVRFFAMAPFHHHLEIHGYHEQTITRGMTTISWFASISFIVLSYLFGIY